MALGFTYGLELEDGTPANPPTFRRATGSDLEGGLHHPARG